jgi:predicted Zn-dependent protease
MSDGVDFLSRDDCQALYNRILGMTQDGGQVHLSLRSQWTGSVRWARNRVFLANELRSTDLWISRTIRGVSGWVHTSRLDDVGLQDAIRIAESHTRIAVQAPIETHDPYVNQPILHPTLFNEETYRTPVESRVAMVQRMIEPAESSGFASAGAFTLKAEGNATITSEGMFRYYPQTAVECAVTVRDGAGTTSGWAGVNHDTLAKIDPLALASRALDKARHGVAPKAIEPGRYTTILEPQATADLFGMLVGGFAYGLGGPMSREGAEAGATPFSGRDLDWTKIGLQVIDARLTMSADPMDPDGGFIPYERYTGTPYPCVHWIERGILRELVYSRTYALKNLGSSHALFDPGSFRLAATPGVPTISVEQMIANTERGLVITRFSDVEQLEAKSLLCTGFTRDGVWLVEHGKISKPIKNLRFVESPLIILNKLLDVGSSVRVFKPGSAWLAPAIRVNDFNFTTLADAV